MTGFVKGFVKPELNEGQQELLDLFIQESGESEDWREPVRIDKVVVETDDSILIYTSRFIQLDHQYTSVTPVRHLQIMEVHRSWDHKDPYCHMHLPVRYREVQLTNVFRTLEGDEGWIVSLGDENFAEDISSLHTDWL